MATLVNQISGISVCCGHPCVVNSRQCPSAPTESERRRTLDQWTRRRLRAVAWTQWKRGRTCYVELRRRGVGRVLAACSAGSPHGPWRLSNSPALNIALSNASLLSLGLASLAVNKAA